VVGVAEVCMINLSESWELIPGRQIRGEERPVQAHHSRNISPIDFPGRCGPLFAWPRYRGTSGPLASLGNCSLGSITGTDTRDYVIYFYLK